MLKGTNIKKSYGTLPVLKGVTINVQKGEIISIVGSSGAGKSTLLQIIGTLDNADAGEILINDINIAQLKNKALSEFRNTHLGFIFQFHHLLPEFSALENVCIPAWIKGDAKKIATSRAKELLDFMKLSDRLHNKPNQLSGGEQQRVAIARALINSPSLVLADEPTGNLDTENSQGIFELIKKLRNELGQTFIIVTHNNELAAECDKTITMKDGVIIGQ
jgi:lipoprotein-releasing system ATP-binding protein